MFVESSVVLAVDDKNPIVAIRGRTAFIPCDLWNILIRHFQLFDMLGKVTFDNLWDSLFQEKMQQLITVLYILRFRGHRWSKFNISFSVTVDSDKAKRIFHVEDLVLVPLHVYNHRVIARLQVLNFNISISFAESFAGSDNLFGWIQDGDFAAAVFEVLSWWKAVFVDLGYGEGVVAWAWNVDLFEVEALLSCGDLFGVEFEIVLILADLVSTEIFFEIGEGHPEATIIFGSEAGFLFELISPKFRFITPSTFPFKLTPGIPEFHKLERVTLSVIGFQNGN